MASKEELYISIDPSIYRAGKSNLLICQASSLGSLKRMYNLKVLARQKSDLKKILLKLMKSINVNINLIKKRMPTPSVPNTINVKEPVVEIVETVQKPEKSISKSSSLDLELRMIQEKLTQLNS